MWIKHHTLKWPMDQKKKKTHKMNENECRTYQNFRDAAKEVLQGKYVAVNVYIKREKWSYYPQPNFSPKDTEKRRGN